MVVALHPDVHTRAHTHAGSHYGFCKDSKENIYVLKVLPVIFSYFFPPAVIIFSPVKQIKTPRPNGGWGSGSDFPLSGSQTRCSNKQALCEETCVCLWIRARWLCMCVCVCVCKMARVVFEVSENSTAHSARTVLPSNVCKYIIITFVFFFKLSLN